MSIIMVVLTCTHSKLLFVTFFGSIIAEPAERVLVFQSTAISCRSGRMWNDPIQYGGGGIPYM